MLTKNDLTQIRKLVREEVEAEGENVRAEVNGEIKLAGIRTAVELREVSNRLKNLEITTRKIQKDLKMTSNFLDKENLNTVKRVRIIEKHLGIPEPAII